MRYHLKLIDNRAKLLFRTKLLALSLWALMVPVSCLHAPAAIRAKLVATIGLTPITGLSIAL
jgi:hypothetical protein